MIIRFFNTYVPMNTLYEDLIPCLVAQGHEVTLVISKAEYRPGRDAAATLSAMPGVNVVRTPHLGVQPRDTTRKILVNAAYAAGAALGSLLGPRADLNVFLTQPPFFAAFWAPLLSRLRGQPFSLVVMDVYPAALVVRTPLREDGWLVSRLTRRTAKTLNRARNVVTMARCTRDRLESMGVQRPINVVPYWIGGDGATAPEPGSVERYRSDLGWTEKFVVYYGGNVGGAFAFDDLVAAAARLAEHDDILFVVMGGGSGLAHVRHLAASQGAGNMVFLPLMHDRYPLATVMRGADVHYLAVRDEHLGIGVPTKAFGAMTAGRPVIYQGHPASEVARVIDEHPIGFSLRNGDVSGLVEGILRLRSSSRLQQELGEAAAELSRHEHGKQAGVTACVDALVGASAAASLGACPGEPDGASWRRGGARCTRRSVIASSWRVGQTTTRDGRRRSWRFAGQMVRRRTWCGGPTATRG